MPSLLLHVPLITPMLPIHRVTKKCGSDRFPWAHQSYAAHVAVHLWHLTAVLECYSSADELLKVFLLKKRRSGAAGCYSKASQGPSCSRIALGPAPRRSRPSGTTMAAKAAAGMLGMLSHMFPEWRDLHSAPALCIRGKT